MYRYWNQNENFIKEDNKILVIFKELIMYIINVLLINIFKTHNRKISFFLNALFVKYFKKRNKLLCDYNVQIKY